MSFLVRWLHVSSVAFVFGGALLIVLFLHFVAGNRDASTRRLVFDLLRAFEWGSWASIGLVVATGVGNLGHFGEALPDAKTEWGRELTVKLLLVLVFLVFSAMRTVAVSTAAAHEPESPLPVRTRRSLRALYGVTAAFVVAIAGVAIALAHY